MQAESECWRDYALLRKVQDYDLIEHGIGRGYTKSRRVCEQLVAKPQSVKRLTRALRWVRPLHAIVATFGPETEEPEVVSVDVGGIRSSDRTRGHRFHAPDEFQVRRFADYQAGLENAHVILDADRRAERREAWNEPVVWPAWALLIGAVVLVLPGLRTFFRERQ